VTEIPHTPPPHSDVTHGMWWVFTDDPGHGCTLKYHFWLSLWYFNAQQILRVKHGIICQFLGHECKLCNLSYCTLSRFTKMVSRYHVPLEMSRGTPLVSIA